MREALEKAIDELKDTNAGWVDRRDAADELGRAAADAVFALRAHIEDSDKDVQNAVRNALRDIGRSAKGAPSSGGDGGPPSLQRIVEATAKAGKREVTAAGNGWDVTASLPEGRKQTVHVEAGQSRGGEATVLVWTQCAESNPKAFEWALKNNSNFALCAIAIREIDGKEMLCMMGSFLADEITPDELKGAVKEVAFYGDWLENTLTNGGDEF